MLEPATTAGYYYIKDTKHNKYIVAGFNYDGNVYHQDRTIGQQNAMWRKVTFTDTYGSQTFYLVDGKHGKALVAGDIADIKVYHQVPHGRSNARWALIPIGVY